MGTLQLDFDELQVGLFGNMPIVGKVDLGTLGEDLGEGAQFDLDCDCAVSGDELPGGWTRTRSVAGVWILAAFFLLPYLLT